MRRIDREPDSKRQSKGKDKAIKAARKAKHGNHNWRGVKRYDVWFRDHNGKPWYGVCMSGGMNQSLKVRPVKESADFPVRKVSNGEKTAS